jgi:cobalt/nickel transport system permease protein
MHIPDGFLSGPVWAAFQALALPAVAWSARRAQTTSAAANAPLLGTLGAFVFAAQMINFPVAGGASGHLVGSALLAASVGPWAASVVMAAILVLQALVFQDGGILALGANLFNMALAGVWAAWLPLQFAGPGRLRRPALVAAGFLSVFVSALLALAQLALSGARLPVSTVWAALGVFALTALIEGLLTLAVFEAIERINPRWVQAPAPLTRPARFGLAAAAVLLVAGGFMLASALPDGLERLAIAAGFASRERPAAAAPLPGYEALFVVNPWLRKALAGLLGLALTYLLCLLLGRWINRWRSA